MDVGNKTDYHLADGQSREADSKQKLMHTAMSNSRFLWMRRRTTDNTL